MVLARLGLTAALLLTLLPRSPAQLELAAPRLEELVVALPPAIVALWEPTLTHVVCFAGDERVAMADAQVGSRITVSTPRAGEIDRLLLIGGAHCRWAWRGVNGSFTWDESGHVIAWRLPPDLGPAYAGWARPLQCWVDMLGPADGQAPSGVAALYPTMSMYHVVDERFVIGVPGPGRWTATFNGDGGGADLLVTCEAMTEAAVPRELPVAEVRTFHCRVRFELTGSLAEDQLPMNVEKLSGPRSTSTFLSAQDEGTFELALSPHDMQETMWIWRSGWEVQRIDGRELTALDSVIVREVRPSQTLRVLVRDAAGTPVPQASVEWRDRDGQRIPAVWAGSSSPEGGKFFWWGSTGPDGVARSEGAPPQHAHALHAVAKGLQHSSVVIDWTAGAESIAIVLSAN
jgi:hypothetical protein